MTDQFTPADEMPATSTEVVNPFAGARPVAVASAESDVARAVTEVQAAMLIARRFPRDERAAMDKILNAFARPGLAEKAAYQYARGGSDIFGPSIRAAETIAQCWGNIYTGVREVEQRGGASTVEAFAWDTETGFHDVKVFQVAHVRHTKSGSYPITDPRDIYEHVANAAARRKRACILAVIPSDVVESAMRQADVTLNTTAETTPEKVALLVKAFADEFGVEKDALEKRIQRRLDAITPAQMVSMRRIYASLRDGMSKPAEWFEMAADEAAKAKGVEGAKDAVRGALKRKEKPGNAATIDVAGAEVTDTVSLSAHAIMGGPGPTGPAPADMMPAPTLADVLKAVAHAADHDALDLLLDMARPLMGDGAAAAEIDVAAKAKRKALGDR